MLFLWSIAEGMLLNIKTILMYFTLINFTYTNTYMGLYRLKLIKWKLTKDTVGLQCYLYYNVFVSKRKKTKKYK